MTARAVRWEGDGITTLSSYGGDDATSILLDLEHATLLPKPDVAVRALRAKFKARPRHRGDKDVPEFQVRDVVNVTNYITAALRHDLPTEDRADTATIWDKWRHAVLRIRKGVFGAIASQPYVDPYEVHFALASVQQDLARALHSPGEIWRNYCPWAADFFTRARLYPEAE